jgi:hypothetical protein
MGDPKDISGTLQAIQKALELKPPNLMEHLQLPDIPLNPLVTAAQANYASEFHKRLTKWISNFDASLDQAHEVGIRLVSFGQAVVFRLHGIGYWNPSLISFQGETEDGNPVELIQHVSQISVLLMKLARKDPSAPKRRIGFNCDVAGEAEEQ